MVNQKLMITATFENVASIQPMGGCADPNFTYFFKVLCENCGETTPKEVCLALGEFVPVPKSGTHAHFVSQCKTCGRKGTISMEPNCGFRPDRPLTAADCEAGKYAPLMGFYSRGLEPLECTFGGNNWRVQTTAGTVFENVDLSGDWAEYDIRGKRPVSVCNLRSCFDVVKRFWWMILPRDEWYLFSSGVVSF